MLPDSKSMCRPSHVEAPRAIGDVIRNAAHFLRIRFKSAHPVVKGQCIVLTQTLDISDFEAVSFCRLEAGIDAGPFRRPGIRNGP